MILCVCVCRKTHIHTRLDSCVGAPQDEVRGSMVPGTDVRDVVFAWHQHFGAAEVAELHDVHVWIKEEVLRLNVAVTHPPLVYVRE